MKEYCTPRFLFALVVLGLMPLTLAGCASHDVPYSSNEPPMLEPEDIPRLNPQTETWRPGYWAMQDGLFVWVPGRVLARPSPTAVWKPARWSKHEFGWSFEPGHWQ